jgi:hypothetical protein
VPGIGDHLHLIGKGFDGVSGNEPGRAQPAAMEEIEQARRADFPREEAARDISR